MIAERRIETPSGNSVLGLSTARPSLESGRFRPFQIVSLYDLMKPFRAGRYIEISAHLSAVSATPEEDGEEDGVLDDEIKQEVLKSFVKLGKELADLELAASFATAAKVIDLVTTEKKPLYSQLFALTDELKGRLIDETAGREYYSLTLEEAQYYTNPRKGWEVIVDRFPKAIMDIEEAWKCFAVSRYTAAVFHSIQVVEVGLIELGTYIGVNDPMSGWTAVAQRLKKLLDIKYHDRSQFEKDNHAFLEQTQGTVEALKNAWRNKVSHSGQKLSLMTGEEFHPDVAEEILLATRAFMRRLTEGLPPREVEE